MNDLKIFGWDIHFHKWIQIEQNTIKRFMNEEYEEWVDSGYRICDKCGDVEEYNYDSQGGCWAKLSPKQHNILSSKIYQENGRWFFREGAFDKPDFIPPASKRIHRPKPSDMDPPSADEQ